MDVQQVDLRQAISAAVEAREDGDYEESVERLTSLYAQWPDDVELSVEYARSLARMKRHADADAILSAAVRRHPDDAGLCQTWSHAPTQINDFGEVIRRAEILRARFASDDGSPAWTSLCVEIDALYESGQWMRLSERLDAYWEVIRCHPAVLPAALVATGKLFQPMRTRLLCDASTPQAWHALPPDTRANLDVQVAVALENQKLTQRSGYRLVSLGQNCLPYQLLGRWGLSLATAAPQRLSPFDLGGFNGDNAAKAILGGFSFLTQEDGFKVVPAWGGGEMLSHAATGIGFFHERGPYWIKDRRRFFDRLRSMAASWDDILASSRRVFVFCLCGAGDVAALVRATIDHLLGPDDYLIVLDVMSEAHDIPQHDRVIYRHNPYPRDYDWTDFGQQTSGRGLNFELGAIQPVVTLLEHLVPDDEAATAEAVTRQALMQRLHEAAIARGSDELADMLRLFRGRTAPAEPDQHTAMLSNRLDRSATARRGGDGPSHVPSAPHAWAIGPGEIADWPMSLARARELRHAAVPGRGDTLRVALVIEIKALQELGRWHDIEPLIREHWEAVLSEKELFVAAAEALQAAFSHQALGELIAADFASISLAASAPGSRLLANVEFAQQNAAQLKEEQARIICLGQDATGLILTGRWGLQPARTSNAAHTIFELGGFDGDSTAMALERGLAQFMNPDSYTIVPAWFGGLMPLHRATGVSFYPYRRHNWQREDLAAFLSALFENIECWRQVRSGSKCVYLFTVTQDCDLERVVNAYKRKLAGLDSTLIVLDMRPSEGPFAADPRVVYLHRAPPPGWSINLSTLADDGVTEEFEREVVSAILMATLSKVALVAE